ncbi:MAG TPA: penicillin-binding protein 1C, partial [Roseovarius nubinhibens]|nr:penicillin-binding protein 1C [Roseovarius nubinhibens]
HILASLAPPPGAPAGRLAYKTGTSYGHRDAWAVGYDGRHVIGVWIGRPDGTPVPGAFGGDLAAPLLFEAYQRLDSAPEPLPPPPPETLLLATANLPQPLRHFTGREAAFAPAPDAPKLIFPPDGARLALVAGELAVKLRDGTPPFTILANGRPVATGLRQHELILPGLSRGFSELSVIDAKGRAARVRVQLD